MEVCYKLERLSQAGLSVVWELGQEPTLVWSTLKYLTRIGYSLTYKHYTIPEPILVWGTLKCLTGVSYSLTCQHYARLERPAKYKHSKLL